MEFARSTALWYNITTLSLHIDFKAPFNRRTPKRFEEDIWQ